MIRELAISGLLLPGDMPARMERAHVKGRASSIAKIGVIHPPVVRRENWEVIAGCDRVAACMLLGHDTILCDVRELSEQQADIIRHAENAERRHDTNEQRSETLAMKAALEAELIEQGMAAQGPGRRPTASAEARRQVAEETGVKEETLRKREQRSKSRPPPPLEQATDDACIRLIGQKPPESLLAQAALVQRSLKELAVHLRHAQTVVGHVQAGSHHASQLMEWSEMLRSIENARHQYWPTSLCPYCKGIPSIQADCALCEKTGWIRRSQVAELPVRFLDAFDPIVVVNGKEMRLADFTGRMF